MDWYWILALVIYVCGIAVAVTLLLVFDKDKLLNWQAPITLIFWPALLAAFGTYGLFVSIRNYLQKESGK